MKVRLSIRYCPENDLPTAKQSILSNNSFDFQTKDLILDSGGVLDPLMPKGKSRTEHMGSYSER